MGTKKTTFVLMYALMGVMAIASTVITTITYKSFAYFELFYLICIATGICLLLSARCIRGHFAAGIILINLGLFVNCFMWSVQTERGFALGLNLVLTAVVFVAGLAFSHAYFNVNNFKMISFICSAAVVVLIAAVAVYSMITGLDSDYTTLWNASIVVRNLSLISAALLPVSQYLYFKWSEME